MFIDSVLHPCGARFGGAELKFQAVLSSLFPLRRIAHYKIFRLRPL